MNDTIYRDEAVEICERWRQRAKKLNDRDGWYMADILLKFMEELPSANRPQGEWIHAHEGTIAEGLFCSNCGKHGYGEKFCPNCGAYMKGAVNESIN